MAEKKTKKYEVKGVDGKRSIGSFTLRSDEVDELREELDARTGGCGDVGWIVYDFSDGSLDWGPGNCRPVGPDLIDITSPFCIIARERTLEECIVYDIIDELEWREEMSCR